MASSASWLPFVRATAIGWVPVAKNAIPPAHLADQRLHTDEKVTLLLGDIHSCLASFINILPN